MTTLRNLTSHPGDSVVRAGVQPDPTALVANLFERYHTAVFAYIYRLVNDRELAHDLCQEAFLRLFRTRDRLAQVENRRAWVYRIASNVTFNALKRRQRFGWLPWYNTDNADWLNSTTTVQDPTESTDQRLAVEQALAQMPPHYRAALLLHSYYGLSVREVAEVLNISQGAVKTRLFRAREMFRQAYTGGDTA